MLPHGTSRRILRLHGEQSKRGALQGERRLADAQAAGHLSLRQLCFRTKLCPRNPLDLVAVASGRIGRIEFELDLGISLLRLSCDQELPATTLEVVWHDHDSGQYATICLVREQGNLSDRESRYITRCEEALTDLHDCVDWRALWETRLRLQAEQSSANEAERPRRSS